MHGELFTIKNLICQYKGQPDHVLKIDSLHIPRNKMVFVLGPSGSGKSTLIETLGLMRNTIKSGNVTFESNGGTRINLEDKWRDQHGPGKLSYSMEDERAQYRKEFLSFVFQRSYLLDNFTAYQNTIIPYLLKKGKEDPELTYHTVKNKWYNKFNLSEIEENHPVFRLSAGQKQRIAFIAGLICNYEVIFGDEPTGNLDIGNAEYLIERLKAGTGSGKSAIVVTHSTAIATYFGDVIYFISKPRGTKYGQILHGDMFSNESGADRWTQNGSGESYTRDGLKDKLDERLRTRE